MEKAKDMLKQSCHIHNIQEKNKLFRENFISPKELEMYDFFFDLAG